MIDLPRLSIVTPSLNQGDFIEETIQSVLNQGYPNLEYIIVDGGSSDRTIDILYKYSRQITWISEPDGGQTDAINKGLHMASGDVFAYLNSDDLYLPGTLLKVGTFLKNNPEVQWLSGYCRNIDAEGQTVRHLIRKYKNFWLRMRSYRALLVLNYIAQPATFWRRSLTEKLGYLDESLHYTMDYEYWLRIGEQNQLHVLTQDLAAFRIHRRSKSGTATYKQFNEELKVAQRYSGFGTFGFHKIHNSLITMIYRKFLKIRDESI